MPTKFKIRHFKSGDLNEILNIERLSFPEPWSPKMFSALYQINPKGFYVAVVEGGVVGYGIVIMEQNLMNQPKERSAHLMNLAIHPRFRNLGIGRKIVTTIISDIKKVGAKDIHLEVRISNEKAVSFYKKFGFEKVWLVRGFYGDEDAIVMSKNMI